MTPKFQALLANTGHALAVADGWLGAHMPTLHISLVPTLGVLVMLLGIGAFAGARTWTHIVAVSFDLLTFSIVKGVYDITISSWCGLQIRAGIHGNPFGIWLGGWLNKIQTDHCEIAIKADMQRAGMALQYLSTGTAPPSGS